MKSGEQNVFLLRVRISLLAFIFVLLLSGITAFPLESELEILVHYFDGSGWMGFWLNKVCNALKSTNRNFPFLAYGTDWLAFAHLLFALLFIGILKDPVRNKWVIQFGFLSCVFIIPLALIAGEIRGIPFFWRAIDCSFGVIGGIMMWFVFKWVKRVEGIDG